MYVSGMFRNVLEGGDMKICFSTLPGFSTILPKTLCIPIPLVNTSLLCILVFIISVNIYIRILVSRSIIQIHFVVVIYCKSCRRSFHVQNSNGGDSGDGSWDKLH